MKASCDDLMRWTGRPAHFLFQAPFLLKSETTGLHHSKEEVMEIGAVAFTYGVSSGCFVAEHHWDEVGWVIAENAWRFETLINEAL